MDEFDFVQNETVEDISSVPQAYQGLYVQGENGYTLSDAAKPLAQAYTGLTNNFKKVKSTNKSTNDENAKRRQQMKAVEDLASELEIDLESLDGQDKTLAGSLREQIEDLRSQAKNGKDVKVNMDKVKADAEKRIQETVGAKDKEISTMQSALHRHMVSDVATRAISSAKGAVELLQPHIERHCKVAQNGTHGDGTPKFEVVVMDGDGDVRTNGKGDNMSVEELVAEMKQSSTFARAFESEAPAGSGTQPGSTQTTRRPSTPKENMTSTDKIRAGLNKGSYAKGGRN